MRRDIVAGVEVHDEIAGQPGRQVGLVAKQILSALQYAITAHTPGFGDVCIETYLKGVAWYAWQLVPWLHRNVAIRVLRRVAAAGFHVTGLEGRIGVRIVGIGGEAIEFVIGARGQALAPRLADIGEEGAVQCHAVDEDDVVV